MSHHVAMPFQVNGGPELDGHLDSVRQAIAAQEGVSGASVQRDAQSGTVTVQFDVASDDHKAVMRSAIRVVKSAVVSAGPDGMWRNWNHDGPTRITAN